MHIYQVNILSSYPHSQHTRAHTLSVCTSDIFQLFSISSEGSGPNVSSAQTHQVPGNQGTQLKDMADSLPNRTIYFRFSFHGLHQCKYSGHSFSFSLYLDNYPLPNISLPTCYLKPHDGSLFLENKL